MAVDAERQRAYLQLMGEKGKGQYAMPIRIKSGSIVLEDSQTKVRIYVKIVPPKDGTI